MSLERLWIPPAVVGDQEEYSRQQGFDRTDGTKSEDKREGGRQPGSPISLIPLDELPGSESRKQPPSGVRREGREGFTTVVTAKSWPGTLQVFKYLKRLASAFPSFKEKRNATDLQGCKKGHVAAGKRTVAPTRPVS